MSTVLLPAAQLSAAQAPVIARLMTNVYVDGANIRVGDIAKLESDDDTLTRNLSGLEIIKAPRIGYVKVLELDDVRRVLDKSFPEWRGKIRWQDGDQVQVHSRGRSLHYEDVAERAMQYFIQQMSAEQRKLIVGVRGDGGSIKVPYGKLTWVPRMNTTYVSKKMCVWMDGYVDEQFYRSVPVWLDVAVREKVFLAKHNIQDRSTVIADDFVLSEVDITDLPASHLGARDFDRPLLIKHGIGKGEALLTDNVKQVPAVIGGRKVDIRVTEGGVRIQLQGVAQRDAEMGELLKIKTLHSGQLLTARVIGKQLVEVI